MFKPTEVLSPNYEKELREKLKFISEECELIFKNLFNIDSANILPKHWVILSKCINNNYKLVDSIIIIHGTDTLAYTSSMLSHMLDGIQIPVIITGNQIPKLIWSYNRCIRKYEISYLYGKK